jgi:hypothetical protein
VPAFFEGILIMLSPRIYRKSVGVTLMLTFLVLVSSGVLIAARWKSPATQPIQPTSSASQSSDVQLEAELVTATPIGFEPGEITRPQGRFLLAIDNRSGLDQLDLYVERETGSRVNSALSRRGKLKWREILDLPAGHYILRAANDQSWRCDINLTPR